MFSGLRRGLKSIDFYQAVPSEYSQGTISGACLSIGSISILVFLVISAIVQFQQPTIDSDLIIDQKHLDQKLKVHVDIAFLRYPCSFLSLDIQNVLKVHILNVQQNLQKLVLPEMTLYSDKGMNQQQKLQRIIQDLKDKKGCRMKGFFQIDRVPGNFHFSSHGYGSIIPELVNQGYRLFDMSHHIYELRFGQTARDVYGERSLADFNSIFGYYIHIFFGYYLTKSDSQLRLFLGEQSYIYTARLNEVVLSQLPMVYFKYETNPMTVLNIATQKQFHVLFVQIVGIIGGIFTVATIIDHLIHSSIHFLVKKHMLNKLR